MRKHYIIVERINNQLHYVKRGSTKKDTIKYKKMAYIFEGAPFYYLKGEPVYFFEKNNATPLQDNLVETAQIDSSKLNMILNGEIMRSMVKGLENKPDLIMSIMFAVAGLLGGYLLGLALPIHIHTIPAAAPTNTTTTTTPKVSHIG